MGRPEVISLVLELDDDEAVVHALSRCMVLEGTASTPRLNKVFIATLRLV